MLPPKEEYRFSWNPHDNPGWAASEHHRLLWNDRTIVGTTHRHIHPPHPHQNCHDYGDAISNRGRSAEPDSHTTARG
jgi:hypothetical protein